MVVMLGTHQETLMESPQTFTYPFYQISQDLGKVFTRLLLFHEVVRWLWQAACLDLLTPSNFCTHFLLCIKFARDMEMLKIPSVLKFQGFGF